MTPEEKRNARICALFASMGSSNSHEAENARTKLLKLLEKHGLSFNDALEIVGANAASKKVPPPPPPTDPPSFNVLDLVEELFKRHVFLPDDERLIASLWTLHTWVFDRFEITPRLLVTSPGPASGKTRLLAVLTKLCREPFSASGITPAALYHRLREVPTTTFLADEGDNYDLAANFKLRRVFNSGHARGGAESLFVDGKARLFPTFAPLALAAIGTLPLPLLLRSFLIRLHPSPHSLPAPDKSASDFQVAREEIFKWAGTCKLNLDPDIPSTLRNRPADNCRVLLAIADDLGCGKQARLAFVAHYSARANENILVELLTDIQTVVLLLHIARITRDDLVCELLKIEGGQWLDYCGLDGKQALHKLRGVELSRILLDAFAIRLKNVWPQGPRLSTTKSAQGYQRAQFEQAWQSYVQDSKTKRGNVIELLGR